MSRHISTFTSADELAAHMIAGERVQLTPRSEFKPESVIADIPQATLYAAVTDSQADEAAAGRLLRQSWLIEIKKAARELFAEWVQEDAA